MLAEDLSAHVSLLERKSYHKVDELIISRSPLDNNPLSRG